MPSARRGQVIKKGDDRYLVRIFLGRDAAGKRIYTSQTVRGTATDAEKALTALLGDADAGRVVAATPMTVAEFLRRWLEAVAGTIEPRTLLFYEAKAKELAPLGHLKLAALSPAVVQQFYSGLAMRKEKTGLGPGPRTVRHLHAVLRSALRWGLKMRLVGTVATDGVLLPKVQKVTGKQTLTPAEAKQLLETAQTAGDSLYALWRVLLECGLRPSEARALRWDDVGDAIIDGKAYKTLRVERAVQLVSLKPRVEEVRGTKTERSRRTIPLTPAVVDALEALPKTSELIFPGKDGLLASETVLKRWHLALRRAGLPRLRVYDTRHTAATLLLEAGVPLKVVSSMLGHSTITTTADTYGHVTDAMAAQATTAMGSVLAPQSHQPPRLQAL